MKSRCECCGQLLPGQFEVDLETNHARRNGREVKLYPQAAEILYVLWRAKGGTVPRDKLKSALWGHLGECPQWCDNVISVHITRLRKEMEALGVTVMTINRRGVRAIVE